MTNQASNHDLPNTPDPAPDVAPDAGTVNNRVEGVSYPQGTPLTSTDVSGSRLTLSATSQPTGARMQVRSSLRHDVGGKGGRASTDADAGPDTASQNQDTALDQTVDQVSDRTATGRFPSPNPLFVGCPSLFLQTASGPAKLGPAAALVTAEETGILLTLDTRTSDLPKALRSAVGECRAIIAGTIPDRSRGHAVLADANRYSGTNRTIATASGSNLDPAWITVQRELGLPAVLTDSPYVPAGDRAALAAVLGEARPLGDDVVAVLPLHLDWLKRDATSLTTAINKAGVPVALVLEHTDDPLGVQDAVAGLVRLLTNAEVKVALLRSDISVIGAVAFGASFGAVGTTTGLRHLYPTKERTGGFNGGARIGTYVPRSMAYRALDTLNTAIALDQEHPERWTCGCHQCYNRPLDHIRDEVAAYKHSLTAIAALGERILGAQSALHRQHAWVGECNHAQITNMEISSETGLKWEPPKFQGAWHKLRATLPPLPLT